MGFFIGRGADAYWRCQMKMLALKLFTFIFLMLYALPTIAELSLRRYLTPWTDILLGDLFGCSVLFVLGFRRTAVGVYVLASLAESYLFLRGGISGTQLIWITDLAPALTCASLGFGILAKWNPAEDIGTAWGSPDHVYLVFKTNTLPADLASQLDDEFKVSIWRPTWMRPLAPTLGWQSAIWSLFHWLRIFRNRSYSLLLIARGGRIVHRSCVVPAYFRWPFMAARDVQVSSTWTDPEFRGQGLATFALRRLTTMYLQTPETIWYMTRVANPASITVCRRASFNDVGYARRSTWMGIRMLGQFVLDPVTTDHP
jgi:RimJ/RimL family protein N-acetyltransferase